MKKIAAFLIAALLPLSAMAARDQISIVGSSTVYPFATVVAEQFGKTTAYKTPVVESTGSGGGLKLFCGGVGIEHPDITNASRAIKSSEIERCERNGVINIIEAKIGYDGIVIANSRHGASFDALTIYDIFTALAAEVPNPDGTETLIENPYTHWNQINPDLPDLPIEVLGPPPTSGTRDAFVELAMEGGAKQVPWLKTLRGTDKKAFKAIAHTIREDGRYVEAGENDNLIVNKLVTNSNALGIFGYSFLDQNMDKIKGAKIDGVSPEFDLISDGSYPVSRALYFYVKGAHVNTIPGMIQYLQEFMSDAAIGDEGYLADKGLIPMPLAERREMRARVLGLKPPSE